MAYDYAVGSRHWAIRLTERPSVTGTVDEASFGHWLADELRHAGTFGATAEIWTFPVAIGDPRDPANLIGPLIDEGAYAQMQAALDAARAEGAKVSGGARVDRGSPCRHRAPDGLRGLSDEAPQLRGARPSNGGPD